MIDENRIAPEEHFGKNSKCFNSNIGRPLCLDSFCDEELGVIWVRFGQNEFKCEHDDQIAIINISGIDTQLQCPKKAVMCPDMICPKDCSGQTVCDWTLPIPKCVQNGTQSASKSKDKSSVTHRPDEPSILTDNDTGALELHDASIKDSDQSIENNGEIIDESNIKYLNPNGPDLEKWKNKTAYFDLQDTSSQTNEVEERPIIKYRPGLPPPIRNKTDLILHDIFPYLEDGVLAYYNQTSPELDPDTNQTSTSGNPNPDSVTSEIPSLFISSSPSVSTSDPSPSQNPTSSGTETPSSSSSDVPSPLLSETSSSAPSETSSMASSTSITSNGRTPTASPQATRTEAPTILPTEMPSNYQDLSLPEESPPISSPTDSLIEDTKDDSGGVPGSRGNILTLTLIQSAGCVLALILYKL